MLVNSPDLLKLQKKVIELVKLAAQPSLEHWDEISDFRLKQDKSPVTKIDIQIEQKLRAQLSQLLPEAGFLVEEGETDLKDEYNWVIDPIDQTKNFVFRLPLFYIHVALLYKNEPIVGIIHNPVSGQTFAGSLGNGVYVNNGKLLLPETTTGYIDIDYGSSDKENAWKQPIIQRLSEEKINFRMTGGAFAPYILTGAINGFFVLNQHTKPMDQYPRMILMKEMGFHCSWKNVKGKKILIAGPEDLYSHLNTIVESCIKEE